MFRHAALIACLVATATAPAIGPADYASAGPVQSDPLNDSFLAAVAYYDTQYYNLASSPHAGPSFAFDNGTPTTIPGYGSQVGVRVWFVSSSSDAQNGMGVTVGSTDSLLFADASAMAFGDYISLGDVNPDVKFFALADIIGGEASWLWVGPKGGNADKEVHIEVSPGSPAHAFMHAGSLWYALALDDQFGGGDRDWNDVRLLIELHPLVAAPEPGTIALFLGFLGLGAWLWRREQALAPC